MKYILLLATMSVAKPVIPGNWSATIHDELETAECERAMYPGRVCDLKATISFKEHGMHRFCMGPNGGVKVCIIPNIGSKKTIDGVDYYDGIVHRTQPGKEW